MTVVLDNLAQKISSQLAIIYEDVDIDLDYQAFANQLIDIMQISVSVQSPEPYQNHWSEQDIIMITYADSVISDNQLPLVNLRSFMNQYVGASINSVHILPFFPYSSDDGFSVIDYSSVNEAHGSWHDIKAIANERRLMADVVINHCSSRSKWFENFTKGEGTGHDYFFTCNADDDVSAVVRPRTSPLLRATATANGEQHVWCTFSHDQVDFDFRNPEVLAQFIKIFRQYLDAGVSIFRLDAVAFIWKKLGSPSINLPQTHEIIRLIRSLVEHAKPDAVLITETNIPNTQNLTYFGNANEAHCIYNFSLPPLLINTLITGNCLYLKRWLMSMPPAQNGTTYFNFIASHDGVGLRPVEGLLSEDEVDTLISTMQSFGGVISWRSTPDGDQKAYEMNIALIDALKGTVDGIDELGFERFICAHAIMLALEGIPGIYIHSLLGTSNDYDKLNHTHHNRSINRRRWYADLLAEHLDDEESSHARILSSMLTLIDLRKAQPAFHPNATQFTLHLGLSLFGFWRQSLDRRQSIFCISNITDQLQSVPIGELNLVLTETWYDLISGLVISDLTQLLDLSPYQTVWLTNKKPE
ncbi:sugar phosphorylase [Thalassotalea eurytherma]|uniref:Sucrose phosphorylase n=1 Tax=Thalassotalea eurytherma TaxID=1144278 RepID=A0ABQ6H5D1_9GAMM|nr:sugar phosphorylase [Thalassotalea eurytherma]GLX82037.1 sucrose phosphorylase [Thalassotalea eurytherma]